MQAIRTRYYGPTNTRGSRIVAKCAAGQLSMPYDHALNTDENHVKARELLVKKLGWDTEHYAPMSTGFFDNDGYHVFIG